MDSVPNQLFMWCIKPFAVLSINRGSIGEIKVAYIEIKT
jgi:hypothetical protein